MKIASGLFWLLLTTLSAGQPAGAQNRSKENFDTRQPAKKGFLRSVISQRKSKTKPIEAGSKPTLSADPVNWNNNQRQQAEQIWLQQRELREKRQEQLKKREPTAWEAAFAKEEEIRQKEVKKVLKLRDKRIAARTKCRHKAMAASNKYKRRKMKHIPAGNIVPPTVFTSVSEQAGAGSGSHTK